VSTASQRARHRDQRESTRREILAAAERFLRERPYRELSVEAVMEGTGLTRTAFYRHFDDTTDLVLRLFQEIGQELLAVAQRWGDSAGAGYPAPAQAGLSGTVDFFVKHGPLVRAIVDAAGTDAQIEAAYRASLDAFAALAARTLGRLVTDGQLQLSDPDAVARALTLMNAAYLIEEFGREPFGDREVALSTLETIWLRVAGHLAVPAEGERDLLR
jgi:TetR/AcrR family transcriptional regulator, ethionamide resistance regulator